jgi:hypothetical protein
LAAEQQAEDVVGIGIVAGPSVLEANGDRRLRRSARVVFEFLSADWTPWQALRRLRRDWPKLAFAVDPRYGEADGASDA